MLCVQEPDSRLLFTGVVRLFSLAGVCTIGISFESYIIWSSQLESRTRSNVRSSKGKVTGTPVLSRSYTFGYAVNYR